MHLHLTHFTALCFTVAAAHPWQHLEIVVVYRLPGAHRQVLPGLVGRTRQPGGGGHFSSAAAGAVPGAAA